MPVSIFAIIGTGLLLSTLLVVLYNRLIGARQRVQESWSTVDTELQRRHDLIPNLIQTVKAYMTHERELIERVVALREEAERELPGVVTQKQLDAEERLSGALNELRLRVEGYPQLAASSNFRSLQAELAHTEDRIQGALRFYNGNVRELNVKVESFPSNLVAGVFGFRVADYFELKKSEARDVPQVQF